MSNVIDLSGIFGEGELPVVQFEHKFFTSFKDLFFRMSEHESEPVIVIRLANVDTVLSIPGVKKEFRIAEDSHDSQMLKAIVESLKYIKGLRIGDPLPKEVTTREASWEPSDRHRAIAYQRLTMQLVTWMTGEETLVTNPDDLLQIAQDPQVRKKVNLAFEEAARALGLGGRKEDVITFIGDLSKELAYIEALRDKYCGAHGITSIEEKMQGLRRLYSPVKSLRENVDQVTRLCSNAVKEYAARFEEVDAQTGEILAVLKNMTGQINYIRDKRDELSQRLLGWDEILKEWRGVSVIKSSDKPELFRALYQFLAPRFMQVNEWALMTRQMTAEEAKALGLRSRENVRYRPGGTMKW